MKESVVAVNANGRDTQAYAGDDPAQERAGPKFVYASGSRPLEGYTIKRGVGHGGFGEIYYAVSDAGKEVALKLVRRNLEVELRGIRQCLNLKHPNLVALYDIREGEHGDTWVVMEYMADRCLQDLLQDNPQGLPTDQVLWWFHGIASAVAYLHDRGIVHRDLKPGNIFSDEGVVKVGDYGLSKYIACSRRSGHTESIGTVHYMAPEVANGRYGKEIDVYALGVVLFEMITGRVPFEGESVAEVLMKHLTASPDVSGLAEPYRSVVARALEKDPAKRFPSVAAMLAELPQAAQPSFVGPPPAAEPGESPPRPEIRMASVVEPARDEEPVARALRDGFRRLRDAWNSPQLNTPVRIVLLVVGIFLLATSANVLFPLGIALLVAYCIYRLVRAMVLVTSPPRPTVPPRAAPSAPPKPPVHGAGLGPAPVHAGAMARHAVPRPAHRPLRPHWQEQAARALVVKSPRERLAELLGSLLLSVTVTAALCVILFLVKSYSGAVPTPAQAAWLLLVSVVGSWAVLIPAKRWEGTRGEPLLRRFLMMVVGLGVGAFAFSLASFLEVGLPPDPEFPAPNHYHLPPNFYGADGTPMGMAYLAAFATLFGVLRWWRQADPLRSARLSIWSVIVTVVVAAVVAGVWHFPQPWLLMVAGVLSVAVQLSSPWVPMPKANS